MKKYAKLISEIHQNLDSNRRKELLVLIILIAVSSILEIVSLGSFLPLLQSLVSENKSNLLISIESVLSNYTNVKPVYIIGLAFLIIFNLNDLIRLVVIRQTNKISFGIGLDASNLILKRALLQPYEKSVEKNSSEFISAIVKKIDTYIYCIIVPIITISSSSIVSIVLILFLVVLLPSYTLFLILLFIALYIPIILYHKKVLSSNDAILSTCANNEVNFLNETFFSIKDIIIDSRQEFAIRDFREITKKIFTAKSSNYTIAQSPRYVIEMISVSLIILLSVFLFDSNYLVISTLALVALSAQRLMPHIQHIYGSYALIRSSYSSAIDILSIINIYESLPDNDKKIDFSHSIEFNNVSYRFHNRDHLSISNLNFIVKRGERIAVIGESGSGKSTFLDLLMGLLSPSKGVITVDGVILDRTNFKAWYPKISYVSQTINILNLTLSENIALSDDKKINQQLLLEVIECAALTDLIKRLPNGLDTLLGEGGRNLSGGERQRIAIARALYKQGDILILDEATSALDDVTEKMIFSKILQLPFKPTVVAVTHSKSYLSDYDRVVEFKAGKILRVVEN
jgi:ATP-binding cassette subfamily B protein